MTDSQANQRDFLGHLLKAIQYRMAGVLSGAPEDFATLDVGAGVRTPAEILSHVSDMLGSSVTRLEPGWVAVQATGEWESEVTRYKTTLSELARVVRSLCLPRETALRLTQGPLADTLTHIGQLAMLCRLAGAPLPGQNFFAVDLPEVQQ